MKVYQAGKRKISYYYNVKPLCGVSCLLPVKAMAQAAAGYAAQQPLDALGHAQEQELLLLGDTVDELSFLEITPS